MGLYFDISNLLLIFNLCEKKNIICEKKLKKNLLRKKKLLM